MWLTAILFTLTYIGLALGKVPGLRIDRAGIALVGATLMLVTGQLTLEQAVAPDSTATTNPAPPTSTAFDVSGYGITAGTGP